MTLEELKAKYDTAQKIIRSERAMRDRVFANNQHKREAKMHEMDVLMEIIVDMKDELKKHIGSGPEQPTLLDVVTTQKASYL